MEQIKRGYQDRIAQYDNTIGSLKKRSSSFVVAKITLFLAFLYSIYSAYPQYNLIGMAFIFLFLAVYAYAYWLDMRCVARIASLCRKRDVALAQIAYLDDDFTSFNDGKEYVDISHEYSYDLDLFGPDSLFHRINRTITKRGERLLAYRLTHLLCDKDDIEMDRDAILELKPLADWRIDFLSQPFIDDNIDSISQTLGEKRRNWFFDSYFSHVSVTVTLLSLVLGLIGLLSMKLFYAMFIFQLLIATILSRRVMHTNMKAEKLRKELRGYHYILTLLHAMEFSSRKLGGLCHGLFNSRNSSSHAFSELSKLLNMFDQRNSEFTYLILNGLFLYDILLIRKFNRWAGKYLSHVSQWVDSIAQFDELVSFATYAYNNPQNVGAEVISPLAGAVIECKDVFHPFLWRKYPVANDFTLMRDNIAIVTGANMAGKSTFLRTIGVNYILACCGAPVAASSFRFSIVSLFSSMRTTDNLSKDISYFNAELLRLQQLIEHVRNNSYTLIILDEILKGTNSKDKLEGSVMFLNEISRYNVAGIIATHDLELSKLEQGNGDMFLNYCFEIELCDDIKYSYKIARGVSKNMNATYLLRNILEKSHSL